MIAKLLLQNLIWVVTMGALLFVPAGTLHWPSAWLFLATIVIFGMAGGLWLAKTDPALLAERMRPTMQSGQPPARNSCWYSASLRWPGLPRSASTAAITHRRSRRHCRRWAGR
jgi:hypothetical protein